MSDSTDEIICSEKFNVDDLPADVLIKIFELLPSMPQEDIQKAADVCRRWQEVIATSPSLMRKTDLFIDFDKDETIDESKWDKLPYKNLMIRSLEPRFKSTIDNFLNHFDGSSVERIRFESSEICSAVEMLSKFQNITHLVVTEMENYKIDNTLELHLPNLTHLQVASGYWLLSRIRTHNLKVLHFNGHWRITPLLLNNIKEFMKTCSGLKHLTLDHFFPKEILDHKLSNLETLEVFRVNFSTHFDEFLKSHSSLKNLSISRASENEYELNFARYSETSNLVYFNTSLEKIVDLRTYHGELKDFARIKSLKNLTIRFPSRKAKEFLFFERLIPCCTEIEILDINLPPTKELEALRIISTLPKLKILVLGEINFEVTEEIAPNFTIGQIEKLSIVDKFYAPNIDIICGCPNIKSLKVISRYECKITTERLERITQSCVKLQEISLLGNFDVNEEDFGILDSISSRIKLKVEIQDKEIIEKLRNLKNRVTVLEHFDYMSGYKYGEREEYYTIEKGSYGRSFDDFCFTDGESEEDEIEEEEEDDWRWLDLASDSDSSNDYYYRDYYF